MDASTRLYKRLGEIPEDPNHPDSLDDLIVCAFGAFERYYLCWKTKGGEYKQDGYELPPALKDWLYPSDGTTRDFDSLQVVFGRGEEYFASDKNGKLEYKEPEVRKLALADDEEKHDKQALRRSRTVSFLRPLSETSVRSDSVMSETRRSNRSSSISSQRTSRPPSLTYTNSRTNSEISLLGDTIIEGQTSQPVRPSYLSQWSAMAPNVKGEEHELSPKNRTGQQLESNLGKVQEHTRTDSLVTPTMPPQPQPTSTTNTRSQPTTTTTLAPSHCTCGCHHSQPASSPPKPTYANATTQTSPPPSPHRNPPSLTIDPTPPYWQTQPAYPPDEYYYEEDDYAAPPVLMGRMSSYFNKPGYQLGDSLFSGYQPINWGQPVTNAVETYVYQDSFGDEALR
ncbi:hypothetical protein COCMIDRAFT_37687 [Bipolaris oryzae ATCC 44560]|uniref:Uncharacterized protein n=1 Tax=Bipolaris oryzae ATCC 44560 TaxID=930090 RepID=W6Z433_COCMI|nr:uncharacterized protein COCMIDRAFT_37687 [Bipolaris oryzae ATCC 44560]EUC44503.1 hypothetical protein COCMIDRAFT_37687 [Bipolaris oryzae ATCC 44560]